MPTLLQSLGRTTHPDMAFTRFDQFLEALPAGVQLLSLLYANPGLLDLIAEIMGGAPRLAEHLSRNPALLEAVLSHGFFESVPPPAQLARELAKVLAVAADYQDVLDLCRRWVKDRQFQIGVALLRGISDGHAAGGPLSDVAQTALGTLLPRVEAEFANQHGRLPGDGVAIVGLGKLGSAEMMIGSDIDLVFLYDVGDETPESLAAMQSDGPRPLAPTHFFARLAQRMINAITAPTGEGKLYEVDMRLRPSGNSGPIASALPSFKRYQEQEAWSWEHLALTRARVIAGAPDFTARIDAVLREILTLPRDAERLAVEVADMRARIAEQRPDDRQWDVKNRRGGLIDVEFIAQYLQLRHGAAHPEALHPTTAEAFRRLADAGVLEPAAAESLIAALRLWHRVQSMQRLLVEHFFEEDSLPAGLRATLARGAGAADFETLKQDMDEVAVGVRAQFERLVGPVRRIAGKTEAAGRAEPNREIPT